ncbi:MAG TPA: bifunctional homocysteine S-methyltransferase/methylenetetrahydrofolate reductase [bacterium]|nr:bifunctional homocysteine S-methyltransferase/methylenetetrahydrofolate reductase [bacterium]HPQ65849.1 bifunctional homocysteine S-methyltransferase/methylenetetrahydrofolate reductase [bacterium]
MGDNPLGEKLKEGIVVFDGAMGTEIYKRNFFINTSYEGLCLTEPEVILDIHRSYREAGAQVLTTNTFAANFCQLSKFGLGEKVEEINRAGVRLARQAGEGEALIAGSVGPLGEIIPPAGLGEEDMARFLARQIEALAGADFIIFETLSSRLDVERACRAAALVPNVPFVISLVLDQAGESPQGEEFATLIAPLGDGGRSPTALGINCGGGPESLLSALEKVGPLCDFPMIVQPNAGVPKNVGGRTIFMTSPEYFTTYALRYIRLGARGVGGCCGTGPEHIRDLVRSLRPLEVTVLEKKAPVRTAEAPRLAPVPTAEKSRFASKLAAGETVTSVEITPPRGYLLEKTVEKARLCREAGIDAINIPDGPRASSRISPLVTAQQILEKAEIEPILHFCCRDRNLIGAQADLLGCAAVGIRNFLFVTGDPPKLGDYPYASAVFDVDSIGMVRIQYDLNCGLDLGGKSVDPPTRALIGVGADPNAIDMEREIERLRLKAEAGAEFVITQPVFAVEPLLAFLERTADTGLPFIAGIWPLASYRNAEFMRNEVPGVIVPDEVMRRMAAARDKEEQKATGIAIAREAVAALEGAVRGFQVSAPFGNVSTAIAVLGG